MSWAAEELKGADLGDKRRNQRLITIVEDLSAQPNESVTQASRDAAAVQGVYEFWANPRIKAEAIISSHASSTVERIKEHQTIQNCCDHSSRQRSRYIPIVRAC
ncbi:MAG: hypothetical protein NHB32_25320 [Fischerella sp. CENA71]|nr:hypothetical protein [Fischerella sp. CENA71]